MPSIQANVTKGQPLKIAANTYNALLDVARRERAKGGASGSPVRFGRPVFSHPFQVTKSATAGSVDVAAGKSIPLYPGFSTENISADTHALSNGTNHIALRYTAETVIRYRTEEIEYSPGTGDGELNINYDEIQTMEHNFGVGIIITNGTAPVSTFPVSGSLTAHANGEFLYIPIATVEVTAGVVGDITQHLKENYHIGPLQAFSWVEIGPPPVE